MGNDNSQITFPIEANNHQNIVQINSKKIKHKEPQNNNKLDKKIKNHKNTKTTKNYIVPRISATPDRNINIPGMNKNSNNSKRYVSYEKNMKEMKSNETNLKKKEIFSKKVKIKNSIANNKFILNITNLLNNIYSSEIDRRFYKTNDLHLGIKSLHLNNSSYNNKNKGINSMFDSIFRYNYFFKNSIKPIKIKSISKGRNKSNSNSPKNSENLKKKNQNEEYQNIKITKINNNKNTKENNIKFIENKKEKRKEHNLESNKNINLNNNIVNQNTTLVLNKFDLDNEVISVNNKKKSNNKNINNDVYNKRYSESRFVGDSESGFISAEEMSLVKNLPQIETKPVKTKEEDASESQIDKQETINRNISNKNRINNNNYFNESNQIHSQKNNNKNNYILKNVDNNTINTNINNNINNIHNNYISNKNYKNLKISTDEEINKIMDKDEEIILSNNESQNTTYLEILLAMHENKNESIINNIKNEYYAKKNKIHNHKQIENNKTEENKKQITPPNLPIKREITPPNIPNKRLTLNMAMNKFPKNSANTIVNNRIINKTKKITPTKKLQINININQNGTKSNFHPKNYSIYNNSNSAIKHIITNNTLNTLNNNNVYSPKKVARNSLSKNKINNSNFSSKKKLDYNVPTKSNNNVPIVTYNNNINNNIAVTQNKNKKIYDSISPPNSQNPSPTNNYNNNYKDRYTYKKMTQINNSLRKKVNETNNISNQYSINASNNNYFHTNDKSTTLYSKINTNNTTKRTNYNYINNKKLFRNSANKNKIIFFKKERLSGNSFNNKNEKNNEAVEVEPRTKSNDQKYSIYSSKIVLATTKKKLK